MPESSKKRNLSLPVLAMVYIVLGILSNLEMI